MLTDHMSFEEWLATRYLPIAGAEGDAGAPPAGGDAPPSESDSEGDEGGGGPSSDEGDDDVSDDDVLEVSRGDYERLRQVAREHDAAQKKAAKDEAARKRKQQQEEGRFEEMMREEAESRAAIEAERDQARTELATERRQRAVESVAKRLGFKDAEDANAFLSPDDAEDEISIERALKRIAKKKPYLVDTRRPTGVPVGGDGSGGPILTLDMVKNMSEDEINANWAEVQKVMSAGQG
jgi:hypothetical protein